MDNRVLFVGVGLIIGIILFFICERKGLIHKWSGLKDPRQKHVDNDQGLDERAS